MTPKSKSILITCAIAVAAATLASGVTYLTMRGAASDARAELDERDRMIEQLTMQLAEGTAAEPTETAEPENPAEDDGTVDTDAQASPGETSRQFAYIKRMDESGGTVTITLDYAQFLTGQAAVDAAAAAGDESPPPNDYYIVNENPRLRTFTLDPGAEFVIAFDTAEDTTVLNAGEFFDAWLNDLDQVRDPGYWMNVAGDTVTGGDEQWLP